MLSLASATLAADDGLALTPPRAWRSWNQFNGAVTQADVERALHGLADRSRLVDGKPTSLADLGYTDAGIDDGWQECGHYGPHQYATTTQTARRSSRKPDSRRSATSRRSRRRSD